MVAVCVRRIPDWGWLIVVNPGLARRTRRVAEAEAHQYIDALKMGWTYQFPVGGADVPIEDAFLSVAAEPEDRGDALRFGRLASAALLVLPLTGCASPTAQVALAHLSG
jgi:hypothetical protein